MDENWKETEYIGYEVSDQGNVRSTRIFKNGIRVKKLLPTLDRQGYLRITFNINGVTKTLILHRLVAIAFIANINKLPQVNHIDGDKTNNRIDNLEWCTSAENNLHACSTGLRKVGELHHKAKLSENDVIEIKEALAAAESSAEIARYYNVNKSLIAKMKAGDIWKSV